MATYDIQARSFEFAVRVVRLAGHAARRGGSARTLALQLLRSGTSIGANLEEAYAAQSRRDFVCRCRIALKEAREVHYWLRLFAASGLVEEHRLIPLIHESNQLVAILTTIARRSANTGVVKPRSRPRTGTGTATGTAPSTGTGASP